MVEDLAMHGLSWCFGEGQHPCHTALRGHLLQPRFPPGWNQQGCTVQMGSAPSCLGWIGVNSLLSQGKPLANGYYTRHLRIVQKENSEGK